MQFYYGEKNILRALDEIEFWKHQEIEHANMLKILMPNLEKKYIEELNIFEREFSKAYDYSKRYIESIIRSKGNIDSKLKDEMIDYIKHCIIQSDDFIRLLNEMLENSKTINNNPAMQELLHHQIRESQYFIGIEQLIL